MNDAGRFSQGLSSRKFLPPGRRSFLPDHFGEVSELRKTAASGGREILMVACCDHGTNPDTLSITQPGQLYIVQNMAATVPHAKATRLVPSLASIEYAVCFMKVKHAIVCGHLDCRLLSYWLKWHPPPAEDVEPEATTPPSALPTETTVREHVLAQLANLESHEFIQDRLREGRLRLHGWIVNDHTARIKSFDPHTGDFVPI
jgi:carbonic anhydrase